MDGTRAQRVWCLYECIERHVLELRGSEIRERAEGLPHDETVRVEHGGEAVRFFSSDSRALRSLVDQLGPGEYYVRETNLEDLFLRATGSSLNERRVYPDLPGHGRTLAPEWLARQDASVCYFECWKMLGQFPRATLAVLDRAGHHLPMEQNELLHALALEWMSRVKELSRPAGGTR